MYTRSVVLFAMSLAAVSAQITLQPGGSYACLGFASGQNFCAGPSLTSPIIIRCVGDVGQPGNCDDNLSGIAPVGVKSFAPCYQASPTSGDAVCSYHGIGYPDNGAPFNITNDAPIETYTSTSATTSTSTTKSTSTSSTTTKTSTIPSSTLSSTTTASTTSTTITETPTSSTTTTLVTPLTTAAETPTTTVPASTESTATASTPSVTPFEGKAGRVVGAGALGAVGMLAALLL